MTLLPYIAKRLLLSIPVLIGITVVTFVVSHVIPADPLASVISERAATDAETVQMYRVKWGLDKPLPEQYVYYITNLLHGDMGQSFTSRRPVASDLRLYFPATIELAFAAMLFAIGVGIPLGIASAVQHNRMVDHLSRAISLVGVSLPVFWLGLIALQFFYAKLHIFPGPGRLDARMVAPPTVTGFLTIDSLLAGNMKDFVNALSHLALPGMVLGSYAMGIIARMTRSSLIEVLDFDYIRTARAKGVEEWHIVIRHAMRNAMIPTLTVVGLAFGSLLAGAVLTETIFSWPGIGRYAVEAASTLDFPAILGVTLLIAVTYVLVNLLVDVLYGVLDPRIRQS